jgi:hypothetical protein
VIFWCAAATLTDFRDIYRSSNGRIQMNTLTKSCQFSRRFQALSQNCEKRLLASSCLSVRPFVRMEQLGSRWMDFHEIWYLSVLRNSVEKIQFSLKPDKITATLHEDRYTFLIISRSDLLGMRTVSDKSFRGNQNTHFMLNNFFFVKSCHLWDNVERYCSAGQTTGDNTI